MKMLLLYDDHHIRIYTAMIYFVNIIILQEGKGLDLEQSFTEIQPGNILRGTRHYTFLHSSNKMDHELLQNTIHHT